ncbi:MAG: anthranilate synthase component I family protein [Flavobacteriales bacterium]|nr:anthranilate synthase component I family protein [Flavobacteriales bacterium]
MRVRIPLGESATFNPMALRSEPVFLYRRLADIDRQVLGVGCLSTSDSPVLDPEGRAVDWTFGHLCYHFNHEGSGLWLDHGSHTEFPRSEWTVPRWVVEWSRGEAVLHCMPGDEQAAREFATGLLAPKEQASPVVALDWHCLTDRDTYLQRAQSLMKRIQRGDIYEVNYCIERVANERSFDPFRAFPQLLEYTDAPFAAFHRRGERYALCMSPERFLAMDGRRVVGEPMKGTRPRAAERLEDERLRAELATDPKERSENIMALDVMRHDLSRIAAPRSVNVEELCGVRSFPRVHQLVSTVSALLADGATPFDAVRAAFPPASMTGAPKRSAMRLIDAMEDAARGLYSGALGFFAPDGTADLNVVIRTVLFDASNGRLTLTTGSALTALCDPATEWEECRIKALSIINGLGDAR